MPALLKGYTTSLTPEQIEDRFGAITWWDAVVGLSKARYVTASCRAGEVKQSGVSQCIIIACLQKLSMKLFCAKVLTANKDNRLRSGRCGNARRRLRSSGWLGLHCVSI